MSAETHLGNGVSGSNGVKPGTSSEQVRAALERTIASEAFGRAERPARFLRYLVETTLRGESHYLKESLLGAEVFGRPASWDPRLDPIVRQEAARLRKRLARYKEAAGDSAEVWIELPVGGYVPIFERAESESLNGAPPAEPSRGETSQEPADRASAAQSTVLEPPGLGHPAPATSASAGSKHTWTRWMPWLALAAVLATGALAAWRLVPREQRPSIVVLPFANLTGETANEYFAAGLTDEITDSLTKYRSLRVIAHSSASHFQGEKADARVAGRELGVTHVLEGSVERSGDRIKVIAHLERASDASLTWSNVYERSASDLFAVQSELASAIAANLRVAAAPAARHTPKPQAFELVMQARYDMQKLSPASLAQAHDKYRRAAELDPEYATPYLGMAMAVYDQAAARSSTRQTAEERKTAEQLFRKALDLDPDLSGAHAMLASLAMQYQWNWGDAERELQLAVAGPPSSTAETVYALLLTYRGRFEEADSHLTRAMAMDPFATATLNNAFIVRNMEGRFAEAREYAERMAAQAGLPAAKLALGLTYVEEGDPQLAMPIFEQTRPSFAQAAVFEAMAMARAGERRSALELLRPFETEAGAAGVSAQWPALAYAFLGDAENTARWMERAADRHDFQALTAAVHPAFARVRRTPRYRALLQRMGLADVRPR